MKTVKKITIGILSVILVCVLIYCIFFHFEKLDYDVDEISKVELLLDGDFDATTVTDKNDIAELLGDINECKTAAPHISLPMGGFWIYTIRFHFIDGTTEDFCFIPIENDIENRKSKMSKLGKPGRGDGEFVGSLVFDFHELVMKTNPTDGNQIWYDAVFHPETIE